MSRYRCTEDGRWDARWLVQAVRTARAIPADATGIAALNRACVPYLEARLRAVLRAKMVFDVVAPGGIVVFTTGCELTAARYSHLTPGSRVTTRPLVEQVEP